MVVEGGLVSTRFTKRVSKWLDFVQFALLPGTCVLCRRPSRRQLDLCHSCETQLKRVASPCLRCGQPLPPHAAHTPGCGACLFQASPIARTLAPLRWEEPASGLLSGFKYTRKLASGRVLSELLAQQIAHSYAPSELPSVLVPVPLHPRKLTARGYNQSLLIARHLARHLDLPVLHALVRRVRYTPAQKGLSAADRRRNLRGAFQVNARLFARLTPGARIALVDDVVTTMSTAKALAAALQAHADSPLECHLWALARA